ncbi:MAG TPA: hypothetical protein VLV45_05015 [Gemmatimonadales bacterium]|nr:hypothetical protein [Gemmatimonadales bacterium]
MTDRRARLGLAFSAVLLAAAPLVGQTFRPPPVQHSAGGTRFGLFGFGMRAGADMNQGGQFVLSATLDIGDLFTRRLRMRPSGDIGVGNGANSYSGSFELLYRLTDDERSLSPYVGGGLALAGHAQCGTDSGCPSLWFNTVLGLEIRFRSTFNWVLEYHAMDAFQRNRLYLGLTTRRGN